MKKEYYLDPETRLTLLIPAFSGFVVREIYIFANLFDDGRDDIVSYLILLLAFIFGVYMIVMAYTEKLVVSSDGISFERVGLSIFIKWEEIDRISFSQRLRMAHEEIFALRERSILRGIERFGVWGKEVAVDLLRYGDDWRNSELGQQIKQYAPHLFTS